MTIRDQLRRYRRKAFERVGSARYSRPALDDLDAILSRYLDHRNGYFVEAGANDGFAQSNTYYLETMLDWKGVLVEGIPELARRCRRERPRSKVFECALVSTDYPDSKVTMVHANLMSVVEGAFGSSQATEAHVELGLKVQPGTRRYSIDVPARTLTSVLQEAGTVDIDFLSLDVEGAEMQALQGLDFERYRPRYMLIEARNRDLIESVIGDYYEPIDVPTKRDVLYRAR